MKMIILYPIENDIRRNLCLQEQKASANMQILIEL